MLPVTHNKESRKISFLFTFAVIPKFQSLVLEKIAKHVVCSFMQI